MVIEKVLFLQQNGEKMEYFQDLQKTKIFSSATEFECQAMMHCFKTRFKIFEKNQHIVEQGDVMDDVVLIVKGAAIAENVDTMGNISIFDEFKRGDVYGLEAAFAGENFYKDPTAMCLP